MHFIKRVWINFLNDGPSASFFDESVLHSNTRLWKGNRPLQDCEQTLFSSSIPGEEACERDCERDVTWRTSVTVMLRVAGGESTKPRRQRPRERHWKKGLMSSTMAVHVRYNSWCISLQDNNVKWLNFALSGITWTKTANFWSFYFKLIAVLGIKFCGKFESDKES